jgi:tetratricopeptide (TPR) repeat protein
MIPCTVYSIKRNRAWRNLYDLYATDMKHIGNSAKGNISYAGELMTRVYNSPPEYIQERINAFTPTIIHYFKKGLEIYPDNYESLNDLATVYLKFSGQPDSAIYFLKKAILLDPKLQPAWVNMGMAYKNKNNLDSALICYNKVLEINPKEYKAVFAIANIYYERGDIEKAVKMNEDMMKEHPEMDAPYLNLGKFYLSHGDTTAAINYFLGAVQKNPGYEVCMQLNSIYRAKGDSEKANYFYGLAIDANHRKN